MKKILLSLFLTVVCLSSYAQHFITDPNFRQKSRKRIPIQDEGYWKEVL